LGIFGKKPPPSGGQGDGGQPAFEFSPEKAKRFFDHARTVHEATNYEYAMTSWLSGLRQDPGSMEGVEGFFRSAAAWLGADPKRKGPSRELARTFAGKTPVERYLTALLEWGCNPTDSSLGVRATIAAAELGLAKPTVWIGERALALVGKDRRPRKDAFLQLMQAFSKVGAFELAVQAGEGACRVDPQDGKLQAEVRNMSAQATMSKGGFDQTGQVGGFRANIRDAEKQRRLEEEERLVKTEETLDRLIEHAKADYEARPGDKPTIRKYAERLLERGTPEDEETAHSVLMKAYETTREFAFRQAAGQIRLRQARRRVNKLAAESNGEASAAVEAARKEYLALELEELKLRVENYPTDLGLKFELGKRLFDLGQYEEAIGLFQEAKAEVKNRSKVLSYLGQAFYQIQFYDGAVETFRQALEGLPAGEQELAMELKYGLMVALQGRAEESGSLEDAEEAHKLVSQIAIQQFNYRDVRQRRETLKALVAKLKGGS
jgi:tetratricopeptide (TPR) repeat protein